MTRPPARHAVGTMRFPAMLRFLEPAPPIPVTMTDAAEIQAKYRYWQTRILISSIIGYALFVSGDFATACSGGRIVIR